MWRAIRAIAVTEFHLRARRTASIVLLLVVAAGVYLIIPDPTGGRALVRLDSYRVVQNSIAIALGTGMFCAIMLSFFGFYLVSSSIRRDIQSRTAHAVAAAPVSNFCYLFGKFLGNFCYLLSIALACMVSAIILYFIRGEDPLNLPAFVGIFCWFTIPSTVFVAAAAIAFEAFPPFSGVGGDLLYFLVWTAALSVPMVAIEQMSAPRWIQMFDVLGLEGLMRFVSDQYHTRGISIGVSFVDPNAPPVRLTGIGWGWESFGMRMVATVAPAALAVAAPLWFHRFDPVRIRRSSSATKRTLVDRFNSMIKPLSRPLMPMLLRTGRLAPAPGVTGFVVADVALTLVLSPLLILLLTAAVILALALPPAEIRDGLIPAIVALLIVALANLVPRDGEPGIAKLLFTAARSRSTYPGWKFLSAAVTAGLFTLVPILRLFAASPAHAVSLLVGTLFLAGSAVAFGILTGSRKLFIALFLMLLYISLNAKEEAALNFAGATEATSATAQAGYVLLTVLIMGGAWWKRAMTNEK